MFDTLGVLILVLLAAAFGFLTTRAWRLKRGFLKWPLSILAGLLTLILTAVLVMGLIGFAKLNQKHDNPLSDLKVAGTADQIARGRQLANICESCHSTNSELPLSGTNFIAKFGFPPIGTFYAPNLTPAGNIKDWTDAEVIRAIREGIHKDGRSLVIMPSENFRNMSDADVQALVAYLRSQPPTGQPTPDNQFNLLGALLIPLMDVQTAQAPVANVVAPAAGTPEHGKYLVDIIGCRDCHGDQLQGKPVSNQPGPPHGPNLTVIVPQWTEAQFMNFFNTGQIPGAGQVPTMTLPGGLTTPKMPWPEIRAVASDADLHDIFTYLHSLPPLPGPQ